MTSKRGKGKRGSLGNKSKTTIEAAERALDAVADIRCGYCGTGVRRSVREGRAWFEQHCKRKSHLTMVKRAKAASGSS